MGFLKTGREGSPPTLDAGSAGFLSELLVVRLREEGFVFDDEDILYVGNQVTSVLLTADNMQCLGGVPLGSRGVVVVEAYRLGVTL